LAILVAVLVNVPLLYLLIRGFEDGPGAFLGAVTAAGTAALLARTLSLVVGVVVVCLAIALPMAWLVGATDLPSRRLWAVLGALPLAFPSYLSSLAVVATLGPRGLLQQALQPVFGIDRLPPFVYGYVGALLSLALFIYPYLYLLLLAQIRQLDSSIFDSSRSLGASSLRSFFRVVLPQLRPSILSGSLLVALYTASDFGAVSIARYDTFTLAIYNAYRGRFDRSQAAALAILLVALTVLFLMAEARAARGYRSSRLARSQRRPVALGRWRWPALSFLATILVLALAVPLVVLSIWAMRSLAIDRVPTGSVGSTLALLLNAAGRSVFVALLASGLAALVALFPVVWAVRERSRWAGLCERLCFSGHALPGIVIALSMVYIGSRHLPFLYQTVPFLIAAYLVRFLPEAMRAVRSSLVAISPSYEEAARSLGKSPMQVLRTLTLPLLRRGLLVAVGLVFLTVMKELPVTLIASPIGFETLATRTWSAASEGIYSQSALPGLLLLLVTALPLYLLVIKPVIDD
jgi:iron(III) transport system permease protein